MRGSFGSLPGCFSHLRRRRVAAGQSAAPPVRLRLPVAHAQALAQPAGATSVVLGGKTSGQLLIEIDPALLGKVLLKPDDLLEAMLCLTGAKPSSGAELAVYRALHAVPGNQSAEPKEGIDFERPQSRRSIYSVQQPGNESVKFAFLPGR